LIDDTYVLWTGRSEGADEILDIVLINEKSLGILDSRGDWTNGDIDKDGVLGNGELLEELITRGWITLGIRTTTGGEMGFGSSWIVFILLSFGSFGGIWLVVEFTSSTFGVKVTENTFYI